MTHRLRMKTPNPDAGPFPKGDTQVLRNPHVSRQGRDPAGYQDARAYAYRGIPPVRKNETLAFEVLRAGFLNSIERVLESPCQKAHCGL